VIEEEDEDCYLGDSSRKTNNSSAAAPTAAVTAFDQNEEVKEEDFNFDLPEKIKPTERDNTIVKKKKEQVADVLALVNNAANFVDEIYKKETPNFNKKVGSAKVQEITGG